MDPSVSPKDENWFLRVCHHISTGLYHYNCLYAWYNSEIWYNAGFRFILILTRFNILNNNNNIYLLQLGCHPVAVVILHVYKIWNWLLINLSRESYWEACSGSWDSWEPYQHLLLDTGKLALLKNIQVFWDTALCRPYTTVQLPTRTESPPTVLLHNATAQHIVT